MPGLMERQIPLKDLSRLDKIANTNAHKAAFYAAVQKGSKLAQLDHWSQLQTIEPSPHKGAKDGEDQKTFGAQNRFPIKSRSMEFREPYKISQKTDYTTQIGGSELTRQRTIAATKLKDQIQSRLLSDAAPVMELPQELTSADECGGIFWWLMNPTSTYFELPEKYRTPAGCTFSGDLADFHEETLAAMFAEAFISRNEDMVTLDGWLGIQLKRRISRFSVCDTEGNGDDNLRVYQFSGESKKIIRTVDFLVVDGGTVRLHPTTYLLRDRETGLPTADSHRSGLMLDMSQWKWRFNDPWKDNVLKDEGGGPRGFWRCAGLIHPESVNGQLAIRCTG
jgi:hypothetical protein